MYIYLLLTSHFLLLLPWRSSVSTQHSFILYHTRHSLLNHPPTPFLSTVQRPPTHSFSYPLFHLHLFKMPSTASRRLNATAQPFVPAAAPPSPTSSSRSRSSTNPSEFHLPLGLDSSSDDHGFGGLHPQTIPPLAAIFLTAHANYQRDIQRRPAPALSPLDLGVRPDYFRPQLTPPTPLKTWTTTAALPLPPPCWEMREAWRVGGEGIGDVIVEFCSRNGSSPRGSGRW